MLRNIGRVRNFGVFDDCNGVGLQDFCDFNLIYGFNYSGKTTLSRAFACLENRSVHPDYPEAELAFSGKDGGPVGPMTEPPVKVRVYNEDFRKRHLRWDEEDAVTPVAIIGEEAIEAQASIGEKVERGQRLGRLSNKLDQSIVAMKAVLKDDRTACARRIRENLSIPGFTRASINTIMAEWGDSPPSLLSDDEVKRCVARLGAEQKERLPALHVARTDVDAVWQEAAETLSARIGSASTIARLVTHPEIARWVGAGMVLHEGAERCEFCDGPLSSDRMAALSAHFSDEHARLMARIDSAIAGLKGLAPELAGDRYPESAFYEEFREERRSRDMALRQARETVTTALEAMIELLHRKRDKPFDSVMPPGNAPDFPSFREAVDTFDAVIRKNNDRTDDFARSKEQARDALTKHAIVRDLLAPENGRIERLCTRRRIVRDRLVTESRTLT